MNINKVDKKFQYQHDIEILKNYNNIMKIIESIKDQLLDELSKYGRLILKDNNTPYTTTLIIKRIEKNDDDWYDIICDFFGLIDTKDVKYTLTDFINWIANNRYTIVEDQQEIEQILKVIRYEQFNKN